MLVILGDDFFSQYYPSYAVSAFVIGGCIAHHKIDMFMYVRKYWAFFLPVALAGLTGGFIWNILHSSISEPPSICKFASIPLFYLLFNLVSRIMNNGFIQKHVVPSSFTVYASHFFFTTMYMHLMGPFITKLFCGMVVVTLTIIIFWFFQVFCGTELVD